MMASVSKIHVHMIVASIFVEVDDSYYTLVNTIDKIYGRPDNNLLALQVLNRSCLPAASLVRHNTCRILLHAPQILFAGSVEIKLAIHSFTS